MKIIMGNYEVEIKAKRVGEDRANKEATCFFINNLACQFFNAAYYLDMMGCPVSAEKNREDAHTIHAFLEARHFYDDVRTGDN